MALHFTLTRWGGTLLQQENGPVNTVDINDELRHIAPQKVLRWIIARIKNKRTSNLPLAAARSKREAKAVNMVSG
jgi:hypothetical protein